MKMRRTTFAFLAAALVVAGCAGDSDESTDSELTVPTEASTAATEAPTDDATAAPDATTPADTTAATDPPNTEAPAPTAPPLVESAEAFGLLTEPVEVGSQPELVWEAVDGAARYRVVILDGEGLPYWSWSGPETSVFLGGGQSSDGVGPSVGAGFTWSVVALDADDVFVAASALAPLAS